MEVAAPRLHAEMFRLGVIGALHFRGSVSLRYGSRDRCLHRSGRVEYSGGLRSFRARLDRRGKPVGRCVASGGADGRVLLWSLSGRRVVVECRGYRAPVRSVDISADRSWVASGSEDHTVRIWDRTTSLHRTLRQHRDWVRAVCFLGDSDRVASASEDETTVIWSLKEAQPILWIALPHPYQGTSIREVRGLTQAQRSALLALGCNEEPRSIRAISVTEAAGSKIALRQLTREDWHVLRDLRLRALRDAPEAFDKAWLRPKPSLKWNGVSKRSP